MSSLFKNIKGELSQGHLEILLAMYDLNNPTLKEILAMVEVEQKNQFIEFEKSGEASRLREFRLAHLPVVDFNHLPDSLDEDTVNKIYVYYKINTMWHAVSSMLTLEQLMQMGAKESAVQREQELIRLAAMTEEEKLEEAEKWRKLKEDPTPGFYGNIGHDTWEEYIRKYGGKKN